MKTTLKRGIGRSADVNGDGRAVFPPGVGAPMTIYRQPARPRRSRLRLAAQILLWLMAVALMLAGGVAGGAYLYVERDIADRLQARTPDLKIAQEKLDVVVPGQPTTALVLGYDKRAGREAAETGHSDTLMLLRADPDRKTISLLSFPRDLLVDIRCPNRYPYRDRINMAYSVCGAQGSLETIRNLTGVKVNYLITVNFRGFKQIVARMGGIWMDVDRRYFNDNSQGGERYARIDLKPGYQKLNGQKALDFVRYRHTDSDLYRLARQQEFVKAVKQRLSDFPLDDLPKLVRTVVDNVEVGKSGATELNARTILGYALFAYRLPAGHVFQAKLDPNRLTGYAELSTDEANIQQAVQDFLNPDVEAPEKATAAVLGRSLRKKAPPPSSTTVSVLNGNGRTGSATQAAGALSARGYQIVYPPNGSPANAPSWDYFHTTVYFDPSHKRSKAAAQKLAKLFGDGIVTPMKPSIGRLANGAMVAAVVGQTFHGSLAPAPVDRTPQRQPPYVRTDPSVFRSMLQGVRRKVGFPLELPTVVERTSYATHMTPLRVYDLDGHRAVRLTFSTGADEYWGIQETSWDDAPVLATPNSQQTLGGREFHLYYSGAHLHMIVLKENGGTYWVVNTLLDRLSNETMLSIAKGLRPLKAGSK
jgi:polyisoprenyl-teichoic acid--peptidoglycan teichoic acid transferase